MNKRNTTNVKKLTQIGMLSAIAVVLMLFEFALPFAPSFYELDFSEVPVLIGCFAMGPGAGALIELVKILLNLLINGTKTVGVGELANFVIGCAFCVPAGMIYRRKRTKKGAIWGMVSGTLFMTIAGGFINAYVMLPTYAKAFGWPLEDLIAMGTKINPAIDDLSTFILYAVVPFNLLKGVLVSLVVALIYKRIRVILK